MKIENRTFIVSGGSSGLGLATVLEIHRCGGYSAVIDIQDIPEKAKLALGSKARYFKCDLSKSGEIEQAVNQAVSWSKETNAKLGGVINSGGVAVAAKASDPTITGKGVSHSLDVFEFAMRINVIGTFDLTRRTLEHLIRNDPEGEDGERGVVIMVSSAAAFEGQEGQLAYAASKGAVRAMTLPMARDLARFGIRVNTIAPALFVSPMMERMSEAVKQSLNRDLVFPKRFGHPDEFAHMVKYLIEATYVNGETHRLSGAGRMSAKL